MNRYITAAIALAMAFTLNACDSGGGDDGNNPDGGVPFNENSQVYNGYYDDNDVIHIGTPYTGNGIIELAHHGIGCGGSNNDYTCHWDGFKAGSVTDGVVKLELPTTVDEYLEEGLSDILRAIEASRCDDYPEGLKTVTGGLFVLTNNSGDYIGSLIAIYDDERIREIIVHSYFSKSGKINCNLKDEYEDHGVIYKYNRTLSIDGKAGWNKMYMRITYSENGDAMEVSTKNILTKELKWVFELD